MKQIQPSYKLLLFIFRKRNLQKAEVIFDSQKETTAIVKEINNKRHK